MQINTEQGVSNVINETHDDYMGVYQPRDGRDALRYTLPSTGISLMKVIPPVRNKVNTTDLIGPSSQPYWASGSHQTRFILKFE